MDTPAFVPNLPSTRPGWITNFARFGLAAKGIVYSLVGTLAFMAAFEIGGKTTQKAGKQGVMQFILEQPFGKILLSLVAVGLTCYTLWRLLQAFLDTEDKGNKVKGLARRAGYAFSGALYGALAFYAFQLITSQSGSSGNSSSRQTVAGELLTKPFGQWLLGAVALGTIILGLNQIYRGISGKYMKKIESSRIQADAKPYLIRAGKLGYIARGIVWAIIGYLLLKAAWAANAQKAGGTEKVFSFLEETTYGSFLLAAMGLGLICYGVFMFVRAKYETIKT